MTAATLSSAHFPLCAFQSAFWQAAPQYDATAHLEHFFSRTPSALHDQQSSFRFASGTDDCRCCRV